MRNLLLIAGCTIVQAVELTEPQLAGIIIGAMVAGVGFVACMSVCLCVYCYSPPI